MTRLRILLTVCSLLVFLCFVTLFLLPPNVYDHSRTAPNYSQSIPERIVSLAPNLTEILFALGLGEKVVAVSNDSDFPSEAVGKKKIGTFWQPDTEAVIASRPELVVTLWFEQQKTVADTLSRLGYKVLTVKIEKIEELFTAIMQVGFATDCVLRAYELTDSIRTQLGDLHTKFDSSEKIKVLWVVQAEPLRVAGRNTFINELIELVGGENAIGSTIQQYPPISSEEILTCEAEVIIQAAMSTAGIDEQQQAAEIFWDRYKGLPAVKNNRIYVVDSDIVLRLGPRLPRGLELIGRYLHPDISMKKNQSER